MSKTLQDVLRSCASMQKDFAALDQSGEVAKTEPYAYNEISPRLRNLADLVEKGFQAIAKEFSGLGDDFQASMDELKSIFASSDAADATEEMRLALQAQMQPVFDALEQAKGFLAAIPVRFSMLQTFASPEHQEASLSLVSALTEECGNLYASLSIAAGASYEEAINAFAQETMLQTGIPQDQQEQFFSEVGDHGAQG